VKKMLICCSVLCMALLLFCGSALAVELEMADAYSGAVSVQEGETEGTYTVTRSSGVEEGQLYLILIQQVEDGAPATTAPLPTKDNVFYMDVAAASGSAVTFTAFPKEMGKGTYVVYLSDYEQGGAAKGVATITVTESAVTIVYGDINGDGDVTATDRAMLARYVAKLPGWFGESAAAAGRTIHEENADLNNDGQITPTDRAILARYVAKLPGWTTLPRT